VSTILNFWAYTLELAGGVLEDLADELQRRGL